MAKYHFEGMDASGSPVKDRIEAANQAERISPARSALRRGMIFSQHHDAPEVAIETIRQHREILTALLEKNWSAARRALSHHILENHPILGNQVGGGESAE